MRAEGRKRNASGGNLNSSDLLIPRNAFSVVQRPELVPWTNTNSVTAVALPQCTTSPWKQSAPAPMIHPLTRSPARRHDNSRARRGVSLSVNWLLRSLATRTRVVETPSRSNTTQRTEDFTAAAAVCSLLQLAAGALKVH